MRRVVVGTLVALAGVAACTAVMVPLRDHLSLATPALVLVVPVVAGTVVGGFGAGVVAVAAGFLAYDFFFIPPSAPSTSEARRSGWPWWSTQWWSPWCRCWSTPCGAPGPKRSVGRGTPDASTSSLTSSSATSTSMSCWPPSSRPSTRPSTRAGPRCSYPTGTG